MLQSLQHLFWRSSKMPMIATSFLEKQQIAAMIATTLQLHSTSFLAFWNLKNTLEIH